MLAVPPLTPLTTQLDEVADPTIANAVLLLLQVPPIVASCNVTALPAHNTEGPVILAGVAFTVTGILTVQPRPSE
jgi:hypothetical protein